MRNKGVHAKLSRRTTAQAMEERVAESSKQEKRAESKSESKSSSKSSNNSNGSKGWKQIVLDLYEKHYKQMVFIPVLLLVLAFAQVAYQYTTTGDFFAKDVSLSGGISLTLHRAGIDIPALEKSMADTFGTGKVSVRSLRQAGDTIGVIIETTPDVDSQHLLSGVENSLGTLNKNEYSIEITGSSLGQSFFKQLFRAFILAFILMAIVVIIYFRSWAPAAAVLLAVFSDVVETIAAMNLIGERFSGAGIAALLMLIGYSVSSDMLLSTRVLKRKDETVYEGIFSTLKPGLMMTFTTLISVSLALLFTQSDVIRQIMLVLFFGLLFDIFNTWIQNAGILIYYDKHKRGGN